MRTNERGVTLVDVSIAAVIIVIIIGVAYPGFIIANDTISRGGQKTRLENASDRIRKAIVSEMRTGQLAGIAATGEAPYVDIDPPRTGIALDEIADEGTVPWQTVTHRLGFRQTGVLNESVVKVDINRDGDRADTFALGVIELTTPLGVRPITQRGRVILGMPNFDGDVSGDGVKDPLFQVANRRFTMRMFLVHRDEKGHYHQTNLIHSVYLRNIQK